MNYRPDIDGLRAVAVLSVVLCHCGVAVPGGYVGVDVFFVISGYLIAGLMLKDLRSGTFSLVHFWERRARRILPALFVVVAASLILGWFMLVPKLYEMFGRSVVSLMLLRSNVFFSRHTGYFASGAEDNPLLHTWSLSVEEQFYLFIPLLFWAAARMRREAWLGAIVGVLAVISLACSIYGAIHWGPKAYFPLSTRAWELFAGVLTALFARNTPRVPAAFREVAAVLGLAGVALPCFLYGAATPFPGLAALPPVLGTVLLIVFGSLDERATCVHRLLSSRPAVSVGLISYSLYLWHWPLMVFIRSFHNEMELTASGRALLIMASAALAFITYRYVERPFRGGRWLASRRRLLVATACVFVCLFTAGQALRYSHGVIDRLPERAQLFARTGADNFSWCHVHQAEHVPHRLLRVGAAGVEPRLLVWGDSHAGVVMPVIHEMCLASGIAARCAMYPARPPVVHHCAELPPDALAEANAFGAAVMEYATSSDVEAVLLAAFWSVHFSQPKFADSLLHTIDELRAAGRTVYFLKDVPAYDFDVAAALIINEWHGNDVTALSFLDEDYEGQNRHHRTFLPLLVERGVKILDPIPYLRAGSTANSIPSYNASGSFYFDRNHLSLHGARVIQVVFSPIIEQMVQPATRATVNPLLAKRAAKQAAQPQFPAEAGDASATAESAGDIR